jgi:hypothetical protein
MLSFLDVVELDVKMAEHQQKSDLQWQSNHTRRTGISKESRALQRVTSILRNKLNM